MIATVLDQPSPLRAVEHPKSKTVYYGARASNISADPRIAVIDKDCISLQKATDNPCAWKDNPSLVQKNSFKILRRRQRENDQRINQLILKLTNSSSKIISCRKTLSYKAGRISNPLKLLTIFEPSMSKRLQMLTRIETITQSCFLPYLELGIGKIIMTANKGLEKN